MADTMRTFKLTTQGLTPVSAPAPISSLTPVSVKDNRVWKTKDGKEHVIKDMTTDYIKNCIKMLDRNNATKIKVYKYLKEELESRGEKPVVVKKKFNFISKDD